MNERLSAIECVDVACRLKNAMVAAANAIALAEENDLQALMDQTANIRAILGEVESIVERRWVGMPEVTK